MKYKNIYSAIHNFGQSFTSLMNYIDDDYVIDELRNINRNGYDIEIDWKSGTFSPEHRLTERIKNSIASYKIHLEKQLLSQNIDINRVESLVFYWPNKKRKHMIAIDDRGKEYKTFVNEIK